MQRFSKRTLYSFSRVIEKYRDGWFDKKWNGHIPGVRGQKGTNSNEEINLYNCSDSILKSGNFVYVYGCNMAAYAYEEALFYVGARQAYVNIRGLQAGDDEDDRVRIQTDIHPWEIELQSTAPGQGSLFFAVVKLSDDYDGTENFYYARPYAPTDADKSAGWYYVPTFITTKKENASYRIFDGSNLPWRLLFPDYYARRRGGSGHSAEPPKVVLALMKKLDSVPNVTIGNLAVVAKDTTIDSTREVEVSFSSDGNSTTITASSPLSAVGDKFRKGQKVLVSQFENDYVIINAEC